MKVDIRQFSAKDTSDDMDTLWYWLKHHGSYLPSREEMPAIGYVASLDGYDIAVAFLRQVEGGFAQLDGLCTNPWQPGDLRHTAIDALVETCLNTAKELSIKSVLSFTADKGTLMRSRKHGFVQFSHAVIVCSLPRKE